MTPVQSYLTSQMSEHELKAVFSLIWQIWPWHDSFEEAFADFKKNIPENARNGTDRHRFVIWKDKQVVAHTSLFARKVHTDYGSIQLGAL